MNSLMIIYVLIALTISIKSIDAGRRTCWCEWKFERNNGFTVYHRKIEWAKSHTNVCRGFGTTQCKNDCKNNHLAHLDPNAICNEISNDDKLAHIGSGFKQIQGYKYSSCTSGQWESNRLHCPICDCKVWKLGNSQANELILHSPTMLQASFHHTNSFYSQCINSCDSLINQKFSTDPQTMMNQMCEQYSNGLQIYENGLEIHKQIYPFITQSVKVIENVCCNPVCKCSLKFKDNQNAEYLNQFSINLETSKQEKAYKCGNQVKNCKIECRRAAARRWPTLKPLVDFEGHSDQFPFISVNEESTAIAHGLCKHIGETSKHGVKLFLEYDTEMNGSVFPNSDKTFFEDLCCKLVHVPEIGLKGIFSIKCFQ
jgi:hypothetical protein